MTKLGYARDFLQFLGNLRNLNDLASVLYFLDTLVSPQPAKTALAFREKDPALREPCSFSLMTV
jgi:hypothetical protein